MNCVRKHLSAIKGGRLAAACAPARVVTLLISDVPGDDPVGDRLRPDRAGPDHLRRRAGDPAQVRHPRARSRDRRFCSGARDETPKPGDPRLARAPTTIVGAAASLAAGGRRRPREAAGIGSLILSDAIEGEARDVALVHAAIARQVARARSTGARALPCCYRAAKRQSRSGATGRGGRNAEFLLALAIALDGHRAHPRDRLRYRRHRRHRGQRRRRHGPGHAGARGQARAEPAKELLANNDGYTFFQQLGDLVVTGPTLTNVNDFRAILIR